MSALAPVTILAAALLAESLRHTILDPKKIMAKG
jgi:hypothetical protein